MNREEFRNYKVEVVISTLRSEEILNLANRNGIYLSNVRKVNRATLEAQVFYRDYEDLKKLVKRCSGKIKITREMGNIVKVKKIKKRFSFFIGGLLFLVMIFLFSTRMWDISIEAEKNVTPFEIREILSDIGIEQGMSKKAIDLYNIEQELETRCNEILWVRARMEGSVLTVAIREKVNPPKLLEVDGGPVYAKMDGEVKRIYSESGTAKVKNGDLVKAGDILIEGIGGTGDNAFETEARGKVMANTFYTKEVEILINGKVMERTDRKGEDVYLEIGGKKIYLKKFSKSFQNYDKIESNNGIFKKVTYYEKKEKDVKLDREAEVNKALKSLENLLLKELPVDSTIVERKNQVIDIGQGKIKVIGEFAVEQNIAHR